MSQVVDRHFPLVLRDFSRLRCWGPAVAQRESVGQCSPRRDLSRHVGAGVMQDMFLLLRVLTRTDDRCMPADVFWTTRK